MHSIAPRRPTPSLVIGEFTIQQDEEGRYSLNDLHIASGGEASFKPSRWLRNQQATQLVTFLEVEQTNQIEGLTGQIWPVKTTEGRYGGTFAVKELVYAYAMWISPEFTLRVIRAYDSMVTRGGHNLSADMTVRDWATYLRLSTQIMKDLSNCTDKGVARGLYGNLLHVRRFMGVTTEPLQDLAPGVRQMLIEDAMQGGAA